MRELNLWSFAPHLTFRSVSALVFLLVAAMLIVAVLTEAPLKFEAEASVDGDVGAVLPPSELPCLNRFGSLELDEQLSCLQQAKRAAIADVSANSQLARLLENCDGNIDHRVIAGLLDVVRNQGQNAHELAEIVSRFLPHQADIYQGRDKWHVLRLRAYTFVTLSEIGFPDSALPMLVDALAYVDERMSAVEFGAATRVVGTLGERGRRFIPYLLNTLGERFAEEEFSLNRYDVKFPREEATTVQLEVMRSFAAVCIAEDDQALTVLRTIADSHAQSTLDPRLVKEAKSALQTIETRLDSANWFEWIKQWIKRDVGLGNRNKSQTAGGTDDQSYVTPWLEPTERHRLQNLEIALVDQDGRKYVLSQLIDRPVLLTFFYTRCQNAGKCSNTITRLTMLQQELTLRGMASDVRLLAITFEPEFDTPMRLKRYAVDRGLVLGNHALAVRLDSKGHAAFVEELDTPVGYSSGWVNTHGVEAVLLDAEGRLVRKYTTLAWEQAIVVADFQHLLAGQ